MELKPTAASFLTTASTQEQEISSALCASHRPTEKPIITSPINTKMPANQKGRKGLPTRETDSRFQQRGYPKYKPKKNTSPNVSLSRRKLEMLGIIPNRKRQNLSPKKGVVPPVPIYPKVPERYTHAQLNTSFQRVEMPHESTIETVIVSHPMEINRPIEISHPIEVGSPIDVKHQIEDHHLNGGNNQIEACHPKEVDHSKEINHPMPTNRPSEINYPVEDRMKATHPMEADHPMPVAQAVEAVYPSEIMDRRNTYPSSRSEDGVIELDLEDVAQKKRRKSSGFKTRFTDYTKSVLEHAYEFNAEGASGKKFLDTAMAKKLSDKCGISQEQVKQWIRNRNKKLRKRCRLAEAELKLEEDEMVPLETTYSAESIKDEHDRPSFTFVQ